MLKQIENEGNDSPFHFPPSLKTSTSRSSSPNKRVNAAHGIEVESYIREAEHTYTGTAHDYACTFHHIGDASSLIEFRPPGLRYRRKESVT